MKIAIHYCPGSFSDRWISYCDENKIDYKLVNCYNSNIIEEVSDCNGLMWHWSHYNYRDLLFARQLILSIETMGIKVFPNSNTCWHFNDKVGQKYLLEAINAPLVESFVFFDRKIALEWIETVSFPKVFKLRSGAGAMNVKLVKKKKQAKRLIKKAFFLGFSKNGRFDIIKERVWRLKRDKTLFSVFHLFIGIGRIFFRRENDRMLLRERGYVYFQDFIAGNKFDDRIIVIGNKAIHLRRQVRQNDFRASGSGLISYDYNKVKKEVIRSAFDISEKLGTQSLAFDYIYDSKNNPLLVEISYCYKMGKAYDSCQGYWDKNLKWHEDRVNPQRYIIEDFINSIITEDTI